MHVTFLLFMLQLYTTYVTEYVSVILVYVKRYHLLHKIVSQHNKLT